MPEYYLAVYRWSFGRSFSTITLAALVIWCYELRVQEKAKLIRVSGGGKKLNTGENLTKLWGMNRAE